MSVSFSPTQSYSCAKEESETQSGVVTCPGSRGGGTKPKLNPVEPTSPGSRASLSSLSSLPGPGYLLVNFTTHTRRVPLSFVKWFCSCSLDGLLNRDDPV